MDTSSKVYRCVVIGLGGMGNKSDDSGGNYPTIIKIALLSCNDLSSSLTRP